MGGLRFINIFNAIYFHQKGLISTLNVKKNSWSIDAMSMHLGDLQIYSTAFEYLEIIPKHYTANGEQCLSSTKLE